MDKLNYVAALVPCFLHGTPIKLIEGRNLITMQDVNKSSSCVSEETALCYITIDEVRHFELRAFGSQDVEVNNKYLAPEKSVWLANGDELGFLLPQLLGNIAGFEVCWHRYILSEDYPKAEKSKRQFPSYADVSEIKEAINRKSKRYKHEIEAEDTADTVIDVGSKGLSK